MQIKTICSIKLIDFAQKLNQTKYYKDKRAITVRYCSFAILFK